MALAPLNLRRRSKPVEYEYITPRTGTTFNERTKNVLRPARLNDVIGQSRLRALLRRVIDASLARNAPLDHVLLVGPAGFGKTTVANVVANELGAHVFQVEAPVSHETLLELRTAMHDRDVLFIDEVHQQAIMERRGRTTSSQPEVLFGVMEDRTLVSGTGVLDFPAITIIGGTTDEGMLPDPFVARFPLRPTFDPYEIDDLALMAMLNGDALGIEVTVEAAYAFAFASRGVPRLVNNYVRNGTALTTGTIDHDIASEVVSVLNGTTEDGLTPSMQAILLFLYQRCRHEKADGTVVYQASVTNIARATGRGRDVKGVYRDEGYLMEQGLLQTGTRGRFLTENGVTRAVALLNGG